MTSSLHQQESDLQNLAIQKLLNDELGYRIRSWMENYKVKEDCLRYTQRCADILEQRSVEADARLGPYDGATAIFDTFGWRFSDKSDDYGDATVSSLTRWMALWILFTQEIVKLVDYENYESFRPDSTFWRDTFQNYTIGRHDT